jgi:mono/diheme cytochrome c family protein
MREAVGATAAKKNRSLALWVFAIFIIVAAGGGTVLLTMGRWNPPQRANQLQNPVAATAETLSAGKQIYSDHCVACHGVIGDGRGERAEKLNVAPADLRNAEAIGKESDGMVFWKISEGHRPMPGYKSRLSETERWELVDYVRTLGK